MTVLTFTKLLCLACHCSLSAPFQPQVWGKSSSALIGNEKSGALASRGVGVRMWSEPNRSRIWPQKSLTAKPSPSSLLSAALAIWLQVSSGARAVNQVRGGSEEEGTRPEKCPRETGALRCWVQASGNLSSGDGGWGLGSHVQMTGHPANGLEGKESPRESRSVSGKRSCRGCWLRFAGSPGSRHVRPSLTTPVWTSGHSCAQETPPTPPPPVQHIRGLRVPRGNFTTTTPPCPVLPSKVKAGEKDARIWYSLLREREVSKCLWRRVLPQFLKREVLLE